MSHWTIEDENFLFKIPATEQALLNFSQSAYSNYEPGSMNQMKINQGKPENALCDISVTEAQNIQMFGGNRNIRKLQQFIFPRHSNQSNETRNFLYTFQNFLNPQSKFSNRSLLNMRNDNRIPFTCRNNDMKCVRQGPLTFQRLTESQKENLSRDERMNQFSKNLDGENSCYALLECKNNNLSPREKCEDEFRKHNTSIESDPGLTREWDCRAQAVGGDCIVDEYTRTQNYRQENFTPIELAQACNNLSDKCLYKYPCKAYLTRRNTEDTDQENNHIWVRYKNLEENVNFQDTINPKRCNTHFDCESRNCMPLVNHKDENPIVRDRGNTVNPPAARFNFGVCMPVARCMKAKPFPYQEMTRNHNKNCPTGTHYLPSADVCLPDTLGLFAPLTVSGVSSNVSSTCSMNFNFIQENGWKMTEVPNSVTYGIHPYNQEMHGCFSVRQFKIFNVENKEACFITNGIFIPKTRRAELQKIIIERALEVANFIEIATSNIQMKRFVTLFEKERRKLRILETMNHVSAKELVELLSEIQKNKNLTSENITADFTLRKQYLAGLRGIDIKKSLIFGAMASQFANPFNLNHPCVTLNSSSRRLINDENKFFESIMNNTPRTVSSSEGKQSAQSNYYSLISFNPENSLKNFGPLSFASCMNEQYKNMISRWNFGIFSHQVSSGFINSEIFEFEQNIWNSYLNLVPSDWSRNNLKLSAKWKNIYQAR